MCKLLLLVIASFTLTNLCGQLTTLPGKPRILTKKERDRDERNQNCFYKERYEANQRLQFYPFNKASEIKLVSFDKPDSVIIGGELPMKNGSIDYSKIREIKTISRSQIDTLTDILFNRNYGGRFYSFSKINCYYPRNAILFVNKRGNTFAFIEICFECSGYRLSSNKIKAGDFCNQKYDYLKDFFAANGIELGVKKEDSAEE